jgi:recombination protein RecA
MVSPARVSADMVRKQVEAALAAGSGARLKIGPRLVCPGFATGYSTLDAVLQGGLPVAGTTELVGSRSSGRATIAAAYVAARTREGHVCAWVDVAGDMDPQAGLANGMDAARVLWVRCGGGETAPAKAEVRLPVAEVAPRVPLRDKSIGTPGARNRPLVPTERVEQVNSDRQPARRGERLVQAAAERARDESRHGGIAGVREPMKAKVPFVQAKKPWTRMEQAIQAVDLLVQGGGFGVVVLDLGGIAPQYARRIPLATWFRWRAALERARTSLLVLSQMPLTGSSAELILRVQAELPVEGTVMTGISHSLEVVRRRFAEGVEGKRKQPGRAGDTAALWEAKALWA